MKKAAFIIVFILLFLCVPTERRFARAETKFAQIVSENACFYSDASCQYVKFYLPQGYFVKILSVGADYSRVRYMDDFASCPVRDGYVANVDLDFEVEGIQNPYPSVVLTAKIDEVLFSDAEKTQPKVVVPKGSSAVYYGNITVEGESCLYVYAEGYVGYVRLSSFENFNLPPHPYEKPTEIEEPNEESSSSESSEKNPSTFEEEPIKLIIVGIVIVAALCLFYLILRPERKRLEEHSYFGDKDD